MTGIWLFLDFDNTQMRTEQLTVPTLIERFNNLYGDQISHPLTLQEFQQHFHGQTRQNLCDNLSKHFGIQIDFKTLYKDRLWNIMQGFQKTGVEMAPHLIPALEKLQAQGIHLAFVSNEPVQRGMAAMRYATNGQGDTLARFFGTNFFESGDTPKPMPDVYLRAMGQAGATPENSFAVEDSITGLQSSIGAGIPTFGYTGLSDEPEKLKEKLRAAGATACFHDWNQFDPLFSSFRQQRSVKKEPTKVPG